MKAILLLLLLSQEPPLAQEKERIRSKPPLTETERKGYSFPEAAPAKPRAGYTLRVIPVYFSDKAAGKTDLSDLFFEKVAGYFSTASGNQFTLRGKVGAPVKLAVEREKFKDKDLEKAVDPAALEGIDGVAFVAAGGLGTRGTPLWPHEERLRVGARVVDYILINEDMGDRATGIIAHEFMHLLGLADKYDDKKAAVGKACLLGTGYDDRDPAPPCADCREKLGWTRVATIDPREASLVVMEPTLTRSLKIPVAGDGSEVLLLEVRDRLLIWRLGGGQKIEWLSRYPAEAADRLTPFSEPPFRGRSIGARSVWITDIRLEGGKVYFKVGPDAPLTPLEEWRKSRVGKRIGD